MSTTKENNHDKKMDKTLQDDWIPDHQRRVGATSAEITEYGGDIKGKDTIKEKRQIHLHKETDNNNKTDLDY